MRLVGEEHREQYAGAFEECPGGNIRGPHVAHMQGRHDAGGTSYLCPECGQFAPGTVHSVWRSVKLQRHYRRKAEPTT